jgi:hypothetical protein
MRKREGTESLRVCVCSVGAAQPAQDPGELCTEARTVVPVGGAEPKTKKTGALIQVRAGVFSELNTQQREARPNGVGGIFL